MIKNSEWHRACGNHCKQEEGSIPELVVSLNHAILLKLSRKQGGGGLPGVDNLPLISESEHFLALHSREWSTMT